MSTPKVKFVVQMQLEHQKWKKFYFHVHAEAPRQKKKKKLTSLRRNSGLVTCATTSTFIRGSAGFSSSV